MWFVSQLHHSEFRGSFLYMYINDQYNNIVYILYTADISKEKKQYIKSQTTTSK